MGARTIDKRSALLVVVGTRPEAIKLAPLIAALRARHLPVIVCATGQHRDLLHSALGDFGMVADINLDLMNERQTPEAFIAAAMPALQRVIAAAAPVALIVQGDTATALAGALAGVYARLPVVHVEAGLRSGSTEPFPEDMHRRLIAQLATLHFAPTAAACAALLDENIAPTAVRLSGNTGIDAVLLAVHRLDTNAATRARVDAALPLHRDGRHLVLVTVHRRDNHGIRLTSIADALVALARVGDVEIVLPVHPNPAVRGVLNARLGGIGNVHLVPPLGYLSFIALLRRARLVLTDSGGVQEEAPAVGCPVLILRDATERPEGVAGGTARLVGSKTRTIVDAVRQLIDDDLLHARMARVWLPYGDGQAAARIAAILAQRFGSVRSELAQPV